MLEARRATQADSRDLWTWRNDPATRSASLTSEAVAWKHHTEWFDRVLTHPERVIYIGESPGVLETSVGMCRFDIAPGASSAEVSINLNPDHRGKRLSKELLATAIERFHRDFAAVAQLTALIRESNEASKKLFTSVGFNRVSITDGVGTYVLPLTG